MKFVETAVEIERCREAHDTEELVTKFCLLSMYFHVNLCTKINCKEEKILHFHAHCRQNPYQFYSLNCLLLSLAQAEREREKKINKRQFKEFTSESIWKINTRK